MSTFKEYLVEQEMQNQDVEDLSPDDLILRANQMKKLASLKQNGQNQQAKILQLQALRTEIQNTTDPVRKAYLQQRLTKLMNTNPDEEQQMGVV